MTPSRDRRFEYREQPSGLEWPTQAWPRGSAAPDDVSTVAERLFGPGVNPGPEMGVSVALVVVHRGRLVFERYGTVPGGVFAPETPVDRTTPLISWSMAKSITHALTGMMVADGRLSVTDTVDCAEWCDDERSRITIGDLLEMRDGLDFVEDYVIDADGNSRSDVIAMLFGDGASDVAGYARSRPAKHEPGEVWSYSSGTTNILCSVLGSVVGGRDEFETFMQQRLFAPLGMTSARPTFDETGTFIGSSYVHATAEDFARFGYLYLRGGRWDGRDVIPANWVDGARHQHATDPDSQHGYGAHWWIWNSRQGTLAALGYEGQRTIVDFDRDLVVVHLGKWPAETQSGLDDALTQIVESFPSSTG